MMPAKKKEINLLKSAGETNIWSDLLDWTINIGRWIVVLTEFVVICAFLSRFYFDTKLANLFDEINQKRAIVESAAAFEEQFRQVQERIKIVESLLKEKSYFYPYLETISQNLPQDITLDSIEIFSKQEIILSGKGNKFSLAWFVKTIKGSSFEDVSIEKISSSGEDANVFNFIINLKIKDGNK